MTARPTARTYRRRRLTVGALAGALLVGAVMLAGALLDDEEDSSTGGSGSISPLATATPPSPTPDTTVAATAVTTVPPADPLITVRAASPPSAVALTAVARLTAAASPLAFGVMRDGWVTIELTTAVATVHDRAGAVLRTMPLEVLPDPLVIGPDDVLYGLTPLVDGRRTTVALPLDGLLAGRIVAQTPVLDPDDLELAAGELGLAADGIVARAGGGDAVLMSYLALDGTPVTFPDATSVWIGPSDTVRRSDGRVWPLGIDRDPSWVAPVDGAEIVAVAPFGAVHETTLTGPTAGSEDPPKVVARLFDDGSGDWVSLPDGWRLADSARSGTLVRRDTTGNDGPVVELAWLP